MQLNTTPILITHQLEFNQTFFPHRFSVIYDKNQEFFESFGVLNRNATFMIQNFEIVNYYISPVESTTSINFWRLVIDPEGTSKIKKRNIQGRNSIHVKSPFNNTEKSRNVSSRTSIHIKTPFSDTNSKNEKYEQVTEEQQEDEEPTGEDEFLGGLSMSKDYLGRLVSQRKNKTEIRHKMDLDDSNPSSILTSLDDDDLTSSYNNTSNYSTPTPNMMTPITPMDEQLQPCEQATGNHTRKIFSDDDDEDDEHVSPYFADETKFNQYFQENAKVVESANRRKYSIHKISINMDSSSVGGGIDSVDTVSPSSNKTKSDFGGSLVSEADQVLSDEEDEKMTMKKNKSFSNIFAGVRSDGKRLKERSGSIQNIFMNLKKKKMEVKKKRDINEFNYLEIYQNQRYFQFFKLYLASEYSLENALFLESVDDYVEESNIKKRKKICKVICDEFFEANSLKEINISNNVKNSIRVEYDADNFPDNLFEKIVLELKNGVLQDSFSRFILSPYFDDMLNGSRK